MSDKNKEDAKKALELLLNQCNIMNPGYDLGELMADIVEREHRTIAQKFIKEINTFLVKYSETGYDARNEESVIFAKKVKDIEQFFPYV